MARLVITRCEYDAVQRTDIVVGDGFRMSLDQAQELAGDGIAFFAAGPNDLIAPVLLRQNEYGETILATDPSAFAANSSGEIIAPPIVRPRYRATPVAPTVHRPVYAVAA